MTQPNLITKLIAGVGAAAFLAGGAVAGDYGKAVIDDKAPIEASPWSICNIFDHTTLYEGDGFVRKVNVIGRYHGQYTSVSDNLGGGAHFWDHRRFRAGVKAELANDLTFVNTYNLDTSPNFTGPGLFTSVEEMIIEWEPSDDFYVIIGKQKPKITREYATSSKRILTFERSQIVNGTLSDKIWGIAVGFQALGLSHEVGAFSGDYENSWRWPAFNDGEVFTYRTSTGITEATDLFFDYQYSSSTYGGGETFAGGNYRNTFALGTESEWGRFGLVTDIIVATDRNQDLGGVLADDDTHGFVVIPSYDLTDKLQLVAKWAYAADLVLERPQDRATNAPIDNLHTFYAGINYRICGDNLKIMAGYEYATGDRLGGAGNYNSDSWLLGVRTYW